MQDSEEEEETKVVHEPPRRVFVSVGDPLVQGVAVCDYLYPGEGLEDCVNNVKEIFVGMWSRIVLRMMLR